MTAVPTVIDALIAALAVAPGLTEVRIYDGPWIERPSEPDVLLVGFQPNEQSTVELIETPSFGSTESTLVLQVLASSWRGEDDMKTARDRVDSILEAVRGLLTMDPTLGGAVMRAEVSAGHFNQIPLASGREATWTFTVTVLAYSHP